jgi:hypothetical protein
MDLLVALGQITAIIDIWRARPNWVSQVLSRGAIEREVAHVQLSSS